MKVFRKTKIIAVVVAGLALASCGGSGEGASSDTSAANGRVKNAALTSDPWATPCAEGGGCRLGETGPGGGTVFYSGTTAINNVEGVSDGGVYMEYLDVSSIYNKWNRVENGVTIKDYPTWGCKGKVIDGAKDPSVGAGAKSTKAIDDACTNTNIYAHIALNLSNAKSDWFMPSEAEIEQVCMYYKGSKAGQRKIGDKMVDVTMCDGEKALPSGITLSNDRIWTSTEGNYEYGSTFYMNTGSFGGVRKDNSSAAFVVIRSFGVYAGTPPPTTTTTLPPTCDKGGICKVGDIGPGGGTVFYVGTSKIGSYGSKYPGGKYLEFIDPNPTKTYKFKCAIHVHNLKEGVGAGAENTARYRDVCSDADSPIVLATNATNGGKSDWFIPSMEDLNQICRYSRGQATGSTDQCSGKSKQTISGKSFNVAQWSSNQYSEKSMMARSFGDGTSVARDKNKYSYNFFLVRAFG